MKPIRVLVVDDSVVIRRLVTDVLAEDPEIDVIGTASDGRLALNKIASLRPDVVTLDIEMPQMTGLECLAELRKTEPRLPVIMFSTLTERGAAATFDALAIGASDYVTKPANVGSVQAGMQAVRDQLVPRVKALGRASAGRASASPRPTPGLSSARSATGAGPIGSPTIGRSTPGSAVRVRPGGTPTAAPGTARLRPTAGATPVTPTGSPNPTAPPAAATGRPIRRPGGVDLVAIGCSTGGPSALAEIWPDLPASFPVPIVIVQHMPPTFTTLLAERLTRLGTVPVAEAVDGVELVAGRAYIAPGDFHMVIERSPSGGRIRLNQAPPENSCRPAVDPTFRSAADIFGRGVLAVVLTGMGNDGCEGARKIVQAGGQLIAQDEATSVVWGMPGAVAAVGIVDELVPIEGVADAINLRLDRPRGLSSVARGGDSAERSHR